MIGRFISEDPIGFAGGDINLYSYVGNNPVNFIDFEGKGPIAVGICVALMAYDIASTIHTFNKLVREIEGIKK